MAELLPVNSSVAVPLALTDTELIRFPPNNIFAPFIVDELNPEIRVRFPRQVVSVEKVLTELAIIAP